VKIVRYDNVIATLEASAAACPAAGNSNERVDGELDEKSGVVTMSSNSG
jgi:hypothetical protein